MGGAAPGGRKDVCCRWGMTAAGDGVFCLATLGLGVDTCVACVGPPLTAWVPIVGEGEGPAAAWLVDELGGSWLAE